MLEPAQIDHQATRGKPGYGLLIGVLLLLLAFWARIHLLAYDELWLDEAIAVVLARLPFLQILDGAARDVHPPLYFSMLRVWRALVGEEEFALRLLSVLLGLLVVPLAYRIGRQVAHRADKPQVGLQVGLIGMLLAGLAWPLVSWSQEIRMYGLIAMLTACALWAALRLCQSQSNSWRWAVLLGIIEGAGLLSHYLFIQVVVALNLAAGAALFTVPRRWRFMTTWLAAQAIALALYLPWHLYAWSLMRHDTLPPDESVLLGNAVLFFLGITFAGITTDLGHVLPLLTGLGLILLFCMVVTYILSRREERIAWASLAIFALSPPLMVFIVYLPIWHLPLQPLSSRYYSMLSTPAYILISWGVVLLWGVVGRLRMAARLGAATLLVGMVALFSWSLRLYYSGVAGKDDYASLAATLAALRQPGDIVVLNNDEQWQIFDYHYPSRADVYITCTQLIDSSDDAAFWLGQYLDEVDGLWLVYNQFATNTDPNQYLQQFLQGRALVSRRYLFPKAELWFFAFSNVRAAPGLLDHVADWPDELSRRDIVVADGVRLIGLMQALPQLDAGELAEIVLGWHVEPGVEGEWHTALILTDAGGQTLTQVPLTISASTEGDYLLPVRLFVPPSARPGRVAISLIVGAQTTPLASAHIREAPARQSSSILPASAIPLDIRYGDGIVLSAADLPGEQRWSPGESVSFTLYWQPEATISERYKVFIHLMGRENNPVTGNQLWAQQDSEPSNNTTQTTRWLPGQIVSDQHLLTLPTDLPPGHYTIQVGWYPLMGGARLPAVDGSDNSLGDSVAIFELQVAP